MLELATKVTVLMAVGFVGFAVGYAARAWKSRQQRRRRPRTAALDHLTGFTLEAPRDHLTSIAAEGDTGLNDVPKKTEDQREAYRNRPK
jgi:hypothetical protein